MTNEGKGLNGSVNVLADAMRQVFTEAVEGAVEPIHTEVKALRTDVRNLEDGLKTTNENVQAQLAQHREDVRADIQEALKRD